MFSIKQGRQMNMYLTTPELEYRIFQDSDWLPTAVFSDSLGRLIDRLMKQTESPLHHSLSNTLSWIIYVSIRDQIKSDVRGLIYYTNQYSLKETK
jgi:hypothetical protein